MNNMYFSEAREILDFFNGETSDGMDFEHFVKIRIARMGADPDASFEADKHDEQILEFFRRFHQEARTLLETMRKVPDPD